MNLLESYEEFKSNIKPDGLWQDLRTRGFEYVKTHGLPTRQLEDWHYTSVKSLTEHKKVVLKPQSLTAEQKQQIQRNLNPQMKNLVFVNGNFEEALSDELPSGFSLDSKVSGSTDFQDAFDALNAAFLQKIHKFKVSPEISIADPVQFLFVNTGESNSMNHPRVQIEVGSRSVVHLLENYISLASENSFSNPVVEIHIGDSANVTYIRSQEESNLATHIGRTTIDVGANANLESLSLNLGSILARHSLKVRLKGSGSNSQILGLFATRGKQHLDDTTWIEHLVGDCNTNQLYKGILNDESKAVFVGTVYIAQDAQKANSAQLNNNLLLSTKAEANSKPCLNIYADDVKAAHGSTIGQLDKEELFYLQSRAIPKEQAISMMAFGFLSDVVLKISQPVLKDWLLKKTESAFEQISLSEVQL